VVLLTLQRHISRPISANKVCSSANSVFGKLMYSIGVNPILAKGERSGHSFCCVNAVGGITDVMLPKKTNGVITECVFKHANESRNYRTPLSADRLILHQ
jgi:hypothetical protein